MSILISGKKMVENNSIDDPDNDITAMTIGAL